MDISIVAEQEPCIKPYRLNPAVVEAKLESFGSFTLRNERRNLGKQNRLGSTNVLQTGIAWSEAKGNADLIDAALCHERHGILQLSSKLLLRQNVRENLYA